RGCDAGAVHVLERLLDRPSEGRRLQQRAHLVDELRWRDMMMGVDAMRLRGGCGAGAALRRCDRPPAGICGGQTAAAPTAGRGPPATACPRCAGTRRSGGRVGVATQQAQPQNVYLRAGCLIRASPVFRYAVQSRSMPPSRTRTMADTIACSSAPLVMPTLRE